MVRQVLSRVPPVPVRSKMHVFSSLAAHHLDNGQELKPYAMNIKSNTQWYVWSVTIEFHRTAFARCRDEAPRIRCSQLFSVLAHGRFL